MKNKETLEEAAERLYPKQKYADSYYGYVELLEQEAFEKGAKWQQEQIYNHIKELYDNENITGFSKRAYAQCLDVIEQFKNK